EQAKADEKNAELKEKRADAEITKKAVKNIQSKVEKTTLGDLGVLADLKKKMDNETNQESSQSKAKAEPADTEAEEKKASSKKKKAEEKPDAEAKAEATLAETPAPPAN